MKVLKDENNTVVGEVGKPTGGTYSDGSPIHVGDKVIMKNYDSYNHIITDYTIANGHLTGFGKVSGNIILGHFIASYADTWQCKLIDKFDSYNMVDLPCKLKIECVLNNRKKYQ